MLKILIDYNWIKHELYLNCSFQPEEHQEEDTTEKEGDEEGEEGTYRIYSLFMANEAPQLQI